MKPQRINPQPNACLPEEARELCPLHASSRERTSNHMSTPDECRSIAASSRSKRQSTVAGPSSVTTKTCETVQTLPMTPKSTAAAATNGASAAALKLVLNATEFKAFQQDPFLYLGVDKTEVELDIAVCTSEIPHPSPKSCNSFAESDPDEISTDDKGTCKEVGTLEPAQSNSYDSTRLETLLDFEGMWISPSSVTFEALHGGNNRSGSCNSFAGSDRGKRSLYDMDARLDALEPTHSFYNTRLGPVRGFEGMWIVPSSVTFEALCGGRNRSSTPSTEPFYLCKKCLLLDSLYSESFSPIVPKAVQSPGIVSCACCDCGQH